MRRASLLAVCLLAGTGWTWSSLPQGCYWLDYETSVTIHEASQGPVATLTDHEACRLQPDSGGGYVAADMQARIMPRRDGSLEFIRFGETMPARTTLPERPRHPRSLYASIRQQTPVWMARYNVPGVAMAIIRHRRVVWHAELGVRAATGEAPITEQSVFEACSMSKPLFAYQVLNLVEAGQLDLDQPLDSYLPSAYLPEQPEAGKITARMVLDHTTGLPNWRKGGWLKGGPPKLVAAPGEKWTYSGEGFTYLQTVVEHLTGEKIDAYMQTSLLHPMGMTWSRYVWKDAYEDSYAMGHDRKGQLKNFAHYRRGNTAFSLYTTPLEYSRLLIAMMQPHPRRDWQLSTRMRDAMLSPQSRKDETTLCGLSWHIHEGTDGRYYFHGGSNGAGFRCFSRFDPQDGSGMVIMTNSDAGVEVYRRVLALVYPGMRP